MPQTHEIKCSCGATLGEASQPTSATLYQCAKCFQKQELENSLKAGRNFDASLLSSKEIGDIVKKLKTDPAAAEAMTDAIFDPRIDAEITKVVDLKNLRDEKHPAIQP